MDEPQEDIPAGCVICSTKDLSEAEKDKLLQILSAVNIHEGEFQYQTIASKDLLTSVNALQSQKVKQILIFTEATEFVDQIRYSNVTQDDTMTIWSDPISQLITDEAQGEKARRKALWLALKQWA